MPDGRLPKDILFGELTSGKRGIGRPLLTFKDVCKRNMQQFDIDTNSWETLAQKRNDWRSTLHEGAVKHDANWLHMIRERRERTKQYVLQNDQQGELHCHKCMRVGKSRIGLFSRERSCTAT